MSRIPRLARLAAAACCAAALGRAAAHNYREPGAPRYEGSHAPLLGRAAPTSLRVVTFNIEYAKRMQPAIRALGEHPDLRGADLILLQEMDAAGVVAAAAALGLNYVYFPSSLHPKTGRDLGNAVLSPWPIEQGSKVLLPHQSRIVHQARAAVAARVRIGERAVRVYSLHLGSPLGASGGQRRAQAAAVLADIGDDGDPVVIGGDLNSKGLGRAFVAAGFQWPTEKVGGTRGRLSFDHVFVRGIG